MHEVLAEIEDERGYRFYVNSATKVKYKENPQLILIIKKIKSNADAKYQTYRTAIKLIQLKNSLYSECIQLPPANLNNEFMLTSVFLLFVIVYFQRSVFLSAAQFPLSQSINLDLRRKVSAPYSSQTSSTTSSTPRKRPAFTSSTRTSISKMRCRSSAIFSGTSSIQSASSICHSKSSNCRCSFSANFRPLTPTIS